MNLYAIRAIYMFEMARTGRTLMQSIVAPVVSTSLYFVIFGSAIGSRITEIEGHITSGNLDPVARKDFFGLVFVDVHGPSSVISALLLQQRIRAVEDSRAQGKDTSCFFFS